MAAVSELSRRAVKMIAIASIILTVGVWWASEDDRQMTTGHRKVLLLIPEHNARTAALAALLEQVLRSASGQVGTSLLAVAVVNDDDELSATTTQTLVRQHRPDVVVAGTMMLALLVQRAAPGVPLVFDGAADPVASCLVDSLAHPGRRTTGYTIHRSQEPKMLEALLDAYPAVRRIVVPFDVTEALYYDCNEPATPRRWLRNCQEDLRLSASNVLRLLPVSQMKRQAEARGTEIFFEKVCSLDDFARITRLVDGSTAFLVPHHSLMSENRQAIVAKLSNSGLPAVYPHPAFVEAGGVMALAPRTDPFPHREAAEIVVRILGGADASTLPVITPKGFWMLLDLRQVRSQAQRPSLLALRRADEIRH